MPTRDNIQMLGWIHHYESSDTSPTASCKSTEQTSLVGRGMGVVWERERV
jgi:hypothetical protein